MTIARGLLSGLAVATLALSAAAPAPGQADATCIAYMEADAAYNAAFAAALDGAKESGSKAYTAVMLPHRIRYMAAYNAANKAGFEAAQKTGRRCGGFVSKTCRACRRQTGLTVGTVMERSHTPLSTWFWAAYLVASQTPGMSAVQFQRQLGLTRYETAFGILHNSSVDEVRRV